jgi:CBS domain-containing protein
MKVKDTMHKGVDWVSPDTPVTELAKLMRDRERPYRPQSPRY